MSMNVMITGAAHPVGKALVDEFLRDSNVRTVIGTSRRPAGHQELRDIKDPKFHYLQMNVSDDESIHDAFLKIDSIVGEDGLNLLINDQGVLLEYALNVKPNRAQFTKQLDLNTASVLMITQTFCPLLERAAKRQKEAGLSIEKAAVINISSILGSIEKNNGEWRDKDLLVFRVSKAALNCLTKDLSFELKEKGILAAAICPGPASGSTCNEHNGNSDKVKEKLKESVQTVIATMRKLGEEQTGAFFDKHGEPVPY